MSEENVEIVRRWLRVLEPTATSRLSPSLPIPTSSSISLGMS